MLLLIASTFRGVRDVHRLFLVWFGGAVVSAAIALGQFLQKWREADNIGVDFYNHYIGDRITGLMSHWMTFAGEMMIVLLVLAAFVLFSPASRRLLPGWLAGAALVGVAVVLGMTRGVWLATAVGACYLLWRWRPRWIVLIPLAAAVGLWLAPSSVQTRFISMFRPQGEVDSNQQRVVVWRTGWAMIRAHPWFGIGPEHVALEFESYIPEDISRPPAARLLRPPAQHLSSVRRRTWYSHTAGAAVVVRQDASRLRARGTTACRTRLPATSWTAPSP